MSRHLKETSSLAQIFINSKIINWLFANLLVNEVKVEAKIASANIVSPAQVVSLIPEFKHYLHSLQLVFPLLESNFYQNMAEAYIAIINYLNQVLLEPQLHEKKLDSSEFKDPETIKRLHSRIESLLTTCTYPLDGIIDIRIILPLLQILLEQHDTWQNLLEKFLNESFIEFKMFRLNFTVNLPSFVKFFPLIKEIINIETRFLLILKENFKKKSILKDIYFSDNYFRTFFVTPETKIIDDPDAGKKILYIDDIVTQNFAILSKLIYLENEKNFQILSEQCNYNISYFEYIKKIEFNQIYSSFFFFANKFSKTEHQLLIPNIAIISLKNISNRMADTIIEYFQNPEQVKSFIRLNFLSNSMIFIIDHISNDQFLKTYSDLYQLNLSKNFCNWSIPAFFEIVNFIQHLFLAKIRIIDIYAGVPGSKIHELLKSFLHEFQYLLKAQNSLLSTIKDKFSKDYINIWEFFFSESFSTYDARERLNSFITSRNEKLIFKLIPISDLLELNNKIISDLRSLEQKLEKTPNKKINPNCIKSVFIERSSHYFNTSFKNTSRTMPEQKNNDLFKVEAFTLYKKSFQAYCSLTHTAAQEKKAESKKAPPKIKLKPSKPGKPKVTKSSIYTAPSASVVYLEDKDPDLQPLYEIFNQTYSIKELHEQKNFLQWQILINKYQQFISEENLAKVKCVAHLHLTELNLTQSERAFQNQQSIESMLNRDFGLALDMYRAATFHLSEFGKLIDLLIVTDRDKGLIHLTGMISLCEDFARLLNTELTTLRKDYLILEEKRRQLSLLSWWHKGKSGKPSLKAQTRMKLEGWVICSDTIHGNFQKEISLLNKLQKTLSQTDKTRSPMLNTSLP